MASQPGPLTKWPWQSLGNFKYLVLAPWIMRSMYKLATEKDGERDKVNLFIIPFLILRLLHTQLWITFSRYKTAQPKHRIVDKSLDFEQVDRERNWDDQIILTALLFYIGNLVIPGADHRTPLWNTKGAMIIIFLHVGPVEFIYYWLHRALHHHFLYARYHSHHHSSIVTEPITSVIHPFAEELAYFILFAIPILTTSATQTLSIIATNAYLLYVDFMNYLGHCNFELVPKWLFDAFPPLKYLMYTPSFHSLHHTQFRTNYSLFMPLYDYIYGTMDKSSDDLYERSLKGKEEEPTQVVHITHMTTLQSVYHIRLVFASLASKPYVSKWYLLFLWPFTLAQMVLTWTYRSAFTAEINRLKKVHIETWVIPRYAFQYMSHKEKEKLNYFIEKSILQAEEKGARVVTLGLLNQSEELNKYGEIYLFKNPKLRLRIVDGTSLAAAVVLNKIPKGQKEVLIVGSMSKMLYSLCSALCQRGTQVFISRKDLYELLRLQLPQELQNNLVLCDGYKSMVWLLGKGFSDQETKRAAKATHFIPFTQFPSKRVRKDCFYHTIPAMTVPKAYENMHACENWLPRRVMSAWRIAGIIHALEGWSDHECGDTVLDIDRVWNSAIQHGFIPFDNYPSIVQC